MQNKDIKNKFKSIKILQLTVLIAALLFSAACNDSETETIEIPTVSENEVAVYFIKVANKRPRLEILYRNLSDEQNDKKLFYAISSLMKGPTDAEKKQRIGTEIPKEARLISYQDKDDKAIVNLTDQFRSGGGSRTMIMRYKQLYYTVAANAGEKPVYIEIEGKPFKRLGGEGLVTDDPIYAGEEEN